MTISLNEAIKKIYDKHENRIEIVEYKDASSYATFKCNICGNIWNAVPKFVWRGNGCNKCGTKRTTDKLKLDIEYIKNLLKENNCEFLDDKYINTNTPFLIKFKCGHIGKISLDGFRNGTRCAICSKKKMGLSQRFSQEQIDEVLKLTELKFIEFPNGYINRDSIIKHICKYGHIEEHRISVFIRAQGCSECRNIRVTLEKSGSGGSNWKGGKSSITSFMKKQIKQWKKDSIKNCNYSCVLCGEGNRFNDVHHLYSFYKILDESLLELGFEKKFLVQDYTGDDLFLLTNLLLKKHYEHPLGVCLCRKHHKLFHHYYGLTNFTPVQFSEFKSRIQSGEIIISQ